jgi:hypothetical protein
VRGKGTKQGEGCPKVRLNQNRMPIIPKIILKIIPQKIWDFFVRDCFIREKFVAPEINLFT